MLQLMLLGCYSPPYRPAPALSLPLSYIGFVVLHYVAQYKIEHVQVVLLPVLAGAFLNQYFQGLVKFVSPLMPPIAVITVAVLCGNAIAQSSLAILMSGRQVLLAASLLHASGFFFGYLLSRVLGLDTASARTISIEVGMQVRSKLLPYCLSNSAV